MSGFTISVTQLNEYVRARLHSDPFLAEVQVEGEVTAFHVVRGTAYFTLKDNAAEVNCLAFHFADSGWEDILAEGNQVVVRGKISLYVKTGRFSIMIREAETVGAGLLLARMLALQKKLEAAGYFAQERKRPLPPYPREIAVVTSKDGAALQDILKVGRRRNRSVRFRLYPVAVQGVEAVPSILRALAEIERDGTADLTIVARGGGSAGDLSAFNDPGIVKAVTSSSVPVVSAVGHETDWTFCDLAADLRVPTPSAAAEQSIPEAAAISADIQRLAATAQSAIYAMLERMRLRLGSQSNALRASGMDLRMDVARNEVRRAAENGAQRLRSLHASLANQLRVLQQTLQALNPASIVSSGYAVVLLDGRRVYKASELTQGAEVELLFSDGSVPAVIAGLPDSAEQESAENQ